MAGVPTYFWFGSIILFCVAGDAQLSNLLHLVIEEGRTHPISIETSLPEYMEATTIAHVVTLNEYELLANSSNSVCRMGLNDVLSFSETQLSDLDPAEDVDFSDRSFAISFHSGVAIFSLEVADDSIFENEEFFILYIEIPTAIPACALLATIHDNDELSFTWNELRIKVNEDEGIVRRLWIIKHGDNEQNVTVHVNQTLTNDSDSNRIVEAIEGIDFCLLQTRFVFDSDKTNESVLFEVYNDSIHELPEYFYLNLTSESRGVTLDPEAEVYIINRIRFISQPKNVYAGYGETVIIPCIITTVAVPVWRIGYSNGTLLSHFPSSSSTHMSAAADGLNVSIQDLALNVSNYTCSFEWWDVIIESGITHSVIQRSNTGILTINYFSATFSLISQNSIEPHVAYITKGETIHLTIKKEGGGSYNVTVHSTNSSIIAHSVSAAVFESNTKQQNVTFQIRRNVDLNDVLKFEIKIDNVTIEGYGKVNVDTGKPVNVTLYDNVYTIKLYKQPSKEYEYCASISKPVLIYPRATIPLLIENSCLELSNSEVVLTSTNRNVCFKVLKIKHLANCCNLVLFKPQLKTNSTYRVTLQPESINIPTGKECPRNKDQGSTRKGLISGFIVGTLILLVVSTIIFIFYYRRSNKNMCKCVNKSKVKTDLKT